MRVLVLRFSALGDLALLLPVLQSWQIQNPDLEIAMLSRSWAKPLFSPLPLRFYGAELQTKHRGLKGLWRLSREVTSDFKPELIVDQHQVLRSQILRQFWRLQGIPSLALKKDRATRKALTRYPHKERKTLPHVTELYRATFARSGWPCTFDPQRAPALNFPAKAETTALWERERGSYNLGVAPFAQHRGKRWPRRHLIACLQQLEYHGLHLWLWGSPGEQNALEEIGRASRQAYTNMAGRLPLDQEVALMAKLDLVLAMDSANMHLARLSNTPVVSIWGATHPLAGFAPLGEKPERQIQRGPEELDCRPCSIFGAKACFRGDYACMEGLEAQRVQRAIDKEINNQPG